jgi:hypothetical protein
MGSGNQDEEHHHPECPSGFQVISMANFSKSIKFTQAVFGITTTGVKIMVTGHHRKVIVAISFLIILFSFGPAANGAVPAPPAGLATIAGNGAISLTWNASDGATDYILYRGQTSGGPYGFIARTAGTGHTDRGVVNGSNYFYVVTALNADGQSFYSDQVTKAPTSAVLTAPTGITTIPGNGQVSLAWDPVAAAVSYNVYRALSPGGPYTLLTPSAPGPAYTDRNAVNGVRYFYVIQTMSQNPGAYSDEINATPSAFLYVVAAVNVNGRGAFSMEASAAVAANQRPHAPVLNRLDERTNVLLPRAGIGESPLFVLLRRNEHRAFDRAAACTDQSRLGCRRQHAVEHQMD